MQECNSSRFIACALLALIGLSSTLLIANNSLDSNFFSGAADDFEVVELIKWPKIKDGCSEMFLVCGHLIEE